MIRLAQPDDVPTITEMGRAFHEEAGWGDIADYEEADCAASLMAMCRSGDAILLIAEQDGQIVGMAGALTFPLYFNASHRCCQEMFFYMRPGERNGMGKRLLDTLETEARAKGCESAIMVALDKVNPEATGRYYRHRGYRAAEHSWIRSL